MELNAYDEIYEEYIENILSISALSDKDHYIFYKFNIRDNICYDEVFMLNQSGEKGELGKKNFKVNDNFYEIFIRNLVNKFYDNNSINAKDVIYNDDIGTFRMITNNEDIFTITGLSKEQNEELLDMLNSKNHKENKSNEENKEYVISNNTGKVNYLLIVSIIIVLLILIIGLIILF